MSDDVMFTSPCPKCRHWRNGCRHPKPLERAPGGVPGDEQTVRSWQSLADMDPHRGGLAPGRVKTATPCPGVLL